jgi:hypothetical protein
MLTLSIIALILGVVGCVLGTIALFKKPVQNILKVEDIPFITIKGDTIDINGKVEVRDGVYQV